MKLAHSKFIFIIIGITSSIVLFIFYLNIQNSTNPENLYVNYFDNKNTDVSNIETQNRIKNSVDASKNL